MKSIKKFEGFKKSLLEATNGTIEETFDSSVLFCGAEYHSYRVYVDSIHYYNMFVIYNFATNTYDVAFETASCGVSTMSRRIKTQKSLIESVVAWISCNYLNTKKIDSDSEEYTDRCTESEKHYYGYSSEDFINAGIAKECTECPDFCEEDCIENAECAKGNDVFEGCKTVKDVMEVKQDLNTRFGKKVQQYFDTDCLELNNTIIAKIENINHCPNQNTCCIVSPFLHCDYNYKSDACIKAHKNFIHDCESVHKRMKAINNPNWHTVRLATVNSSDFSRLNEKLKLYISAYRELKQTISYLRKCKSINTYDKCYVRYIKKQNDMWAKGKFTNVMLNYIRAKLSMQNVESGVWRSDCEKATGYHESRRYNKARIDL